MEDILVSIHCLAYNHENYIADAIEGFLMQKTNFKFEILIHDDASIDKTADIIREYAKAYPNLIKPIYQIENQYSKGVRVGLVNRKRAKGKYIAICEGDDYWIDQYKLQKQVDYMESHPDCSLCYHDAILVDKDRGYLGLFPGKYQRFEGVKSIYELFSIPSASKLYTRKILEELPDWYFNAPHGDFAEMLICSNYGYIYYFNDRMSAYRTNVPVSIMYYEKKLFEANPNLRIKQIESRINELENYNEWSKNKNNNFIQQMILEEQFKLYTLEHNLEEVRKERFKGIFNSMGVYGKFKYYFKWYTPTKIYFELYNVKNNIKKLVIKNMKHTNDYDKKRKYMYGR